jgi:uncharacterized membrane protein YeaQ/YmgE (transglycosylase-associated protein family)
MSMDFLGDLIKSPFICLGWIIIGALAGAAANRLMHSRSPLIMDIILGWAGSIVGGLIMGLLGVGEPDGGLGLVIVNFIVATIGAVVIIYLVRAVRGRPAV